MSQRFWHLIRYDVRNAKRLRQVAKKLEGYGTRIQYSVFRVRVDNAGKTALGIESNHGRGRRFVGDPALQWLCL